MHHHDGQRREQLQREIPVRDPVQAVQADAVKAQLLGHVLPVQGVGGARQRPGAQGKHQRAPFAVRQAVDVPQQHLGVGHQPVGQRDGLGPLQVGVAGHDRLQVLLSHIAEGGAQFLRQPGQPVDRVRQEHADVQRHLVVAAAGGVQLLARRADALGQRGLHEGVDVLAFHVDGKRPAVDVGEDALQPIDDLRGVLRLDDALPAQHLCVGYGAGDVLPVHAVVKADGVVDGRKPVVHVAAGAASPKFHMHTP